MTIIINNDGTYKTPSKMQTAGAITAGSFAQEATAIPMLLATVPLLNKMKEQSASIDNKLLRRAIKDSFEASNLKSKGVELIDVKATQYYEHKNLIDFYKNFFKAIDNTNPKETNPRFYNALKKETPKLIKKLGLEETYIKILSAMIENGDNAGFCPKANSIVVNMDKLGASAFHEMGHAMNKNQSFFWKSMQKLRGPGQIAASVFATTALFKRKKMDGEKPVSTFDKVTTFIKNNVGKLVVLSFLPMVAEELMASYKGEKLAKEFLPKEVLKKVKFTNRLGASTYVATALLTGAGAYLASNIRDKFAKPKKIN